VVKGYDPVTKILHWVIFALVAVQYAVGEFMPHIGRKTPETGLVWLHITLGGTLMLAIVIAVIWRLTHPVPQLPELPDWQRVAATLTHWALYALVLAMVLLGWPAANARGWPVPVLWAVNLPMVADKSDKWAHDAGDIHTTLVWALLGLVIIHVAAALYHHFYLRDRVMKRIL
jgi:cytochrome b561